MTQFAFIIPLVLALALLWLARRPLHDLFRALSDYREGRRAEPIRTPQPLLRASSELPLEEALAALERMDPRRRKILKLFGLGAGAFVLGKIVGPSLSWFPGIIADGTTYFRNFRIVERGKNLSFYDRFGNEILILEGDEA